jgi:hypothetical protein
MASKFGKSNKKLEVLDEINTIEFEINKEKFKLIISNGPSQIKFCIKDLSSETEYYSEKTLEDLKKINRYFSIFSDLGDLSVNLIKQVKKNNIAIIIETNCCNLQIKNPITDEEFSLSLEKTQSKIPNEQTTSEIGDSSELISKLRKRIEDLEKRMIELESKIGEGKNITHVSEDIDNGEKIFTSNIIKHKEENVIKSWFNTNILSAELIYDTTRDGDSIEDFKNKCFGQFPTLVIIRTDMGFMFGGYATTAWKENGPITDYNSFVFSFNPDKKYNVLMPRFALFGCNAKEKVLFQFGSLCFRIEDNCTKTGNNVIRGSGYEKGLIDLIKGDHKFRVSRLEIFKLNF